MIEIHMKDGDIYEAENILYCGDNAYVIDGNSKTIIKISEIKKVYR